MTKTPARLALYCAVDYQPEWLMSYAACLPAAQQQRASQMKTKRQGQYLAGRLLLMIYAKRVQAQQFDIKEQKNAGPLLIIDHKPVQVSISHTQDLAIAAFSELPIGVDIERVRDNWSKEKIAYFCCEAEHRLGFSIAQASARNEFFTRCWSRKEALTKCHQSSILKKKIQQTNLLDDPRITDFSIPSKMNMIADHVFHVGAMYDSCMHGDVPSAGLELEKVDLREFCSVKL